MLRGNRREWQSQALGNGPVGYAPRVYVQAGTQVRIVNDRSEALFANANPNGNVALFNA